jgi:2-hydroxychromene-2-carboxylate isomerase
MKHITFHFDVISPYAYLAFEKLPEALIGISHCVTYKPVLFGAVLQHFGQLGPAEITPKRAWTYRQIQWLAKEQGLNLQMPASHPFNPIGLLRLGIACGQGGTCNRFVAQRLFEHVWQSGLEAGDSVRLQNLAEQLKPLRQMDDPSVKAALKANTDAAIARGIFGVPTMEAEGQLFWGLDALPMLRAYLMGDTWFASDAWTGVENTPVGVVRKGASLPS